MSKCTTVAPLSAVTAALMLVGDSDLAMSSSVGDFWRILVMDQAGFAIGLLAILIYEFAKSGVDIHDRVVRPLGLLSFAYVLLTFSTSLEVAGRFGHQSITWRTPLAFVAFAISDLALLRLLWLVRPVARSARLHHSAVKMVVQETEQIAGATSDPTKQA